MQVTTIMFEGHLLAKEHKSNSPKLANSIKTFAFIYIASYVSHHGRILPYISFVGPFDQFVLTIDFKHGQAEHASSLIYAFGVAIQVLAWVVAVVFGEQKFAIPKLDSSLDASILATPACTQHGKSMYVMWENNNKHSNNNTS